MYNFQEPVIICFLLVMVKLLTTVVFQDILVQQNNKKFNPHLPEANKTSNNSPAMTESLILITLLSSVL